MTRAEISGGAPKDHSPGSKPVCIYVSSNRYRITELISLRLSCKGGSRVALDI